MINGRNGPIVLNLTKNRIGNNGPLVSIATKGSKQALTNFMAPLEADTSNGDRAAIIHDQRITAS